MPVAKASAPVTAPGAAGAKVTGTVSAWPAARVRGKETAGAHPFG